MTPQESLHEAAKLRLRFQMDNRLRLESLAALSKVFREFDTPIEDELLASLVFAVPEELLGEYDSAIAAASTRPPPKRPTPKRPPPKRPPVGKPNGGGARPPNGAAYKGGTKAPRPGSGRPPTGSKKTVARPPRKKS